MATIKDQFSAVSAFTITLASLANSTAGVGRQSTMIDNSTNLYESAIISLTITTGTTPTANTPIYVFLIRSNKDTTAIRDDGAGASDAGITIVQSVPLGAIIVPAATSNAAYKRNFDTSSLGPLGPEWGIAVVNSSGAALNSTGGNHVASWIGRTQTVA